jgi:hypothetical protein
MNFHVPHYDKLEVELLKLFQVDLISKCIKEVDGDKGGLVSVTLDNLHEIINRVVNCDASTLLVTTKMLCHEGLLEPVNDSEGKPITLQITRTGLKVLRTIYRLL